MGLYFSLNTLSILQIYKQQLSQIFYVLGVLIGAFTLTRTSNILIDWFAKRNSENPNKSNHTLFILKKIIQLFVYVMAFLMMLLGFGYRFVRCRCRFRSRRHSNSFRIAEYYRFFQCFSIYFDRPFEIGDFIIIGDHIGTVTNIGVKSTRIKLL